MDMNQQQLPNESSEKVVTLFRSIQKIFRDMIFEKSKKYGLTGPQLALIFVLYKRPFSTLNELSEQLGLSKSTVCGIVNRLVSQGIVIRKIPENNRRIVSLSLSTDFLNNNDIIDLKNVYLSGIFQTAKPEDIHTIICGLEKLYSLMSENHTF